MTSSNTPENDLAKSTEPEIDTPQLMYCLKCKCHTENKNARIETLPDMAKKGK